MVSEVQSVPFALAHPAVASHVALLQESAVQVTLDLLVQAPPWQSSPVQTLPSVQALPFVTAGFVQPVGLAPEVHVSVVQTLPSEQFAATGV